MNQLRFSAFEGFMKTDLGIGLDSFDKMQIGIESACSDTNAPGQVIDTMCRAKFIFCQPTQVVEGTVTILCVDVYCLD